MRETVVSIIGIIAFIGMVVTLVLFILTQNNTFGIWFLIAFTFFKGACDQIE